MQEALMRGLSVLGFSDHASYPDSTHGRMPYEDLPIHFAEIDRLAELHKSEIVIRKGLEIEYLPRYRGYYEDLLTRRGLDYLLLGEHFYDDHGSEPLIMSARSTEEIILYARAIADALKTGCFAMLAHPDLFAMNHFAWDANCDRATAIILEAAERTGTVIEYNANGYRRGIHPYPDGDRYMYPHPAFWRAASKARVSVIIGADAHEPCQVWDEQMEKAQRALRDLGITPLEHMEDRLPPRRSPS